MGIVGLAPIYCSCVVAPICLSARKSGSLMEMRSRGGRKPRRAQQDSEAAAKVCQEVETEARGAEERTYNHDPLDHLLDRRKPPYSQAELVCIPRSESVYRL
jgi:hypothetical protein